MNPSTDQSIRLGVIGLGRFGRLHAKTIAGLGECQLSALVARRQDSLNELAVDLPGVPGWTNLTAAITESDTDAWVVACTTASHVAVVTELLAAGATVLLEKPISDDLRQAESLQSLVQPDSSNLMMGHVILFNSEFQQLREEVSQRGHLSYMNCVRHRPASIVEKFPGENPLHAAMVHDLYAAQALTGGREPAHVSAQFHRTTGGQIDLALAQLQWENGVVASFAASYLTPKGMPPRGVDYMEVFGDGWACRIDPNPRPMQLWADHAEWPMDLELRAENGHPSGMLAEELRCFCRVVQKRQSVPSGATYHDALQVQRWMGRLQDCAVG